MTTVADVPRHNATAALARLGIDGQALQRIAHQIANDYARANNIRLGDRQDDFIQHLVETGLKAALRYNPQLARGDQGISFVWKIMERRCPDYFRKKSEGFGDRRNGNDHRLVLTGDDQDFDHDIDLDDLMSERRAARWHQAAAQVDVPIQDWVVITLDRAANDLLGRAA